VVAVIDLHAGIQATQSQDWLQELSNDIALFNSRYQYDAFVSVVDTKAGAPKVANCQGFAMYVVCWPVACCS
jgi:hypothetical protein